jgi:uncharacterized membrane protein YkvI
MPFVYAIVAIIVVVAAARLANSYINMPTGIGAIFNVVLGLIVVGVLLWMINTYIPMAGAIKGLLNFVVFVAACVGVLKAFGLWDSVVRFWHRMRARMTAPRNEPEPQHH